MRIYLACENAENTFVQIHNREIAALVPIDNGIRVQANDQIVTHFGSLFEEIQMTDVEQIESSRNVYLNYTIRKLLFKYQVSLNNERSIKTEITYILTKIQIITIISLKPPRISIFI